MDSALRRLTAGSSCAPHTASGNPVRFQTGPLHLRRDDDWQWDMPVHQQVLVTAVTAAGLRREVVPHVVEVEVAVPGSMPAGW